MKSEYRYGVEERLARALDENRELTHAFKLMQYRVAMYTSHKDKHELDAFWETVGGVVAMYPHLNAGYIP